METAVPVSFRGTPWSVSSRRGRGETSRSGTEDGDLISMAHEAQVRHYLWAPSMKVGLVMNFGPNPRFRRVEMRNDHKKRVPVDALWPPQGMGR